MENYTLTKTSESVMINLKNYESNKDSYVVIKGIALMLNTKNKDYADVKKLIDKNKIKVQDIINSTYAKYTKEEAQDKKDQIKTEILEELSEMFNTETIVDISFGSIMYQ
jgi:tRNA isopentenyl-2-thiomethyl-A-37 hydroxylase MiaE